MHGSIAIECEEKIRPIRGFLGRWEYKFNLFQCASSSSQVSEDNRFSILDATLVFFLFPSLLSFVTYQYLLYKVKNTRNLSCKFCHTIYTRFTRIQIRRYLSRLLKNHVTERTNETCNDQSLLDPIPFPPPASNWQHFAYVRRILNTLDPFILNSLLRYFFHDTLASLFEWKLEAPLHGLIRLFVANNRASTAPARVCPTRTVCYISDLCA